MKEYWVSSKLNEVFASKEEKECAEAIADAMVTAIVAMTTANDIKVKARATVGKSKEIADKVDLCSGIVRYACPPNKYHFGTSFKAELQTLKDLYNAKCEDELDMLSKAAEFANAGEEFSRAYNLTPKQVMNLIK